MSTFILAVLEKIATTVEDDADGVLTTITK
jgi:hypothetical protein